MRDIIFRGKRVDNGEWIYGNLICSKNYAIGSQKFPLQRPVVVDPATVGQYTGLTDMSGKKIFAGDILAPLPGVSNFPVSVKWNDSYASYMLWRSGNYYGDMCSLKKRAVVIGNIYDNPELLENKGEG